MKNLSRMLWMIQSFTVIAILPHVKSNSYSTVVRAEQTTLINTQLHSKGAFTAVKNANAIHCYEVRLGEMGNSWVEGGLVS